VYGRVTKCFHDKGYAFIYGEDGKSYFIHYSNLNGEHIERGYFVFFKPFQSDRSDYNAKNISVIFTPDNTLKEKRQSKNKKNRRKNKPCNADRIIRDDKRFQKFVKNFMYEQRQLSKGEN